MPIIRKMLPIGMAVSSNNPIFNLAQYRDTELYEDVNSMRINTKHQDEQINRLKKDLEDKKVERKKSLDNLIAYYYKK